jgi:hypothetical protein
MNKPSFACATLLSLTLAICGAGATPKSRNWISILGALRAGHFSGFLGRDVSIKPIGAITTGGVRYVLYRYAWEETWQDMAGSFPHASYRLLVFVRHAAQLEYLGSYDIEGDDGGHTSGTEVIFDCQNEFGNKIRFDKGGPPSTVLIDGEERDFSK